MHRQPTVIANTALIGGKLNAKLQIVFVSNTTLVIKISFITYFYMLLM